MTFDPHKQEVRYLHFNKTPVKLVCGWDWKCVIGRDRVAPDRVNLMTKACFQNVPFPNRLIRHQSKSNVEYIFLNSHTPLPLPFCAVKFRQDTTRLSFAFSPFCKHLNYNLEVQPFFFLLLFFLLAFPGPPFWGFCCRNDVTSNTRSKH